MSCMPRRVGSRPYEKYGLSKTLTGRALAARGDTPHAPPGAKHGRGEYFSRALSSGSGRTTAATFAVAGAFVVAREWWSCVTCPRVHSRAPELVVAGCAAYLCEPIARGAAWVCERGGRPRTRWWGERCGSPQGARLAATSSIVQRRPHA
eukprot:scaffold1115_cov390-Prasinococcus_capsulatus_cf.AAC.6